MNRMSLGATGGLVALVTGCGGGGGAPTDAVPGPDASFDPSFDDAPSLLEVRIRTFDEDSGDTNVIGRFLAEPDPSRYGFGAPVGACRGAYRNECAPACEGDEICAADACSAVGLDVDVGDVELAGGGTELTLDLATFYNHYEMTALFAPGTTITASADSPALGSIALTTTQPEPLVVVGLDQLELAIGTPLVVRWTPADPGSRVRLTMGTDLGHALVRKYQVECDAPDEAGAITIPQAMVDELADPANWGCGDCFGHELARYRRDEVTSQLGPVELRATSPVALYLRPTL